VLAGIAGLAFSGCSGSVDVDRQIDRVAETISAAEARGALRCAPRELAIARSHLEFAQLEQEQGFPSRARQHLDVAEENMEAAIVLSPPARCASAGRGD
jgi:hypothetical protein